jgi:parallel beta-helix repeat protein
LDASTFCIIEEDEFVKRLLVFIFTVVVWQVAFPQNYYLSTNGSDSNEGTTAAQPWKSLNKLQGVLRSLQPGDSILFERGSVFVGTLNVQSSGSPEKKIYIGAYGKGAKPLMKGSTLQNHWTLMDNNIWVSACDTCQKSPTDLFINNKAQPLGRFPNSGYRVASSQKRGVFVDTSLGFPDADWKGAEVVVKSKRWILDRFPVKAYKNAVLETDVPDRFKPEEKSSYFIQNHLATLDSPGEWCFDAEEKKFYIYATQLSPAKNKVEISSIDLGLIINTQHDIVIENISFANYENIGVQITNSNNISFRQNEISHAGVNGIEVRSCTHPQIENNLISDVSNNSVIWDKNDDGIFIQNKIVRTGMVPGKGKSGDGAYIAFYATGGTRDKKTTIQNNIIDSTGYSAIDFRNGSTLVKNNVVSNFCLIKDDGGGIYTWTNAYGNNIIEGNIILGRKTANTARYSDKNFSYGIYIDDRSKNIVIRKNTIAYCSVGGIFIHNSNGLEISENTLLGNGENSFHKEKGQFVLRRDGLAPESQYEISDLNISKNTIVSTMEDQYCIYLIFAKDQPMSIGSLTNNEYTVVRPLSFAGKDESGKPAVCRSPEEFQLADWQKLNNQDQHSTLRVISNPYFNLGRNLIENGDMTGGTRHWVAWPSQISLKQDQRTLNAPSLKVYALSDSNSVVLYYAGLRLNPTTIYRVSFSVKANSNSDMEFVPMMAVAPYKTLSENRCLKIDPTARNFIFYFSVTNGKEEARLNFRSNTSFWIDNVVLNEMSLKSNSEQNIGFVYNDTSDPKTFSVAGGSSVSLPPFESKVIFSNK